MSSGHEELDDAADDIVDIGIGSTPTASRPKSARAAGSPSKSIRATSWKPVVAVIAVVAALVVAASALIGDVRDADQALPSPTPPAEDRVGLDDSEGDSTSIPDPNRPVPTQVVVPVVRGDLIRAGERCRIETGDGRETGSISFTVPDGLTARCGSTTQFWTDPVTARTGGAPLGLEVVASPGASINSRFLSFADLTPDHLDYRIVAGRRAWTYGFAPVRNTTHANETVWPLLDGVAIDVPGGLVDVTWTPALTTTADVDLEAAFTQLVDSIAVDGSGERFPFVPTPYGVCSGDHWVTPIPRGWFGDNGCNWLNTSSESPLVLDCECLPPLWIEHVSIPFDGDFGFTEIDSDERTTRADGTPVRIIEGLRPDANNFERELRAMVIDAGPERVVAMAARTPQHALPGHRWDDTVDAQAQLIDWMQFHSLPSCGEPGQRWIAGANSREVPGAAVLVQFANESTFPVPVGAALTGTGCISPDGSLVEVRPDAEPALVAWARVAELREPELNLCPTGDGTFDPRAWNVAAAGDFDGDGRTDTAYLARPFDGAPTFTDVPTIAILFANGGLAEGTITGPDGSTVFDADIAPRRIMGMGRDLLELRYHVTDTMQIVELRDATDCFLETFESYPVDLADVRSAGYCAIRRPLQGDVVRIWQTDAETQPPRQVGFTLTALNGELGGRSLGRSWAVCGPELGEPDRPRTGLTGDRVALAGTHELSLQWISARGQSPGTIEFTPLDRGRFTVTGSQLAPPGASLWIDGVIERVGPDEFAFDGTITSVVPQLNAGEPCVRNAGQRFVRRPGTETFRMVDRVNCDGARTDWIDITIVGGS